MSDLSKCDSCRGTKNIMGAGFIYHKCEACKGVGFIEVGKEAPNDSKDVETLPKKRGRKKSK